MATEEVVPIDAKICVICLETVSERVIALPCKHDCFDFPCLGSWLVTGKSCPVCKSAVEKLEYEFDGPSSESRGFDLSPLIEPDADLRSGPTHQIDRQRQCRQRPLRRRAVRRSNPSDCQVEHDVALDRRRHVYRHRLLSLHVGTNRISRYRDFAPRQFRHDELLQSRARKWIRRELEVFEFLDLDRHDVPPGADRRRGASNAEFLVEYTVAILKVTDVRGSGGQAEELLKDFLGRRNARIFLHELQAWLRSPYHHLREWDRAVQYKDDLHMPRCSSAT